MAYKDLRSPPPSSDAVKSSMKGNKGKDTRPEILLRSALHRSGKRYRTHYKKVPGSPDLAFVSKKLAIFVDGCFWHGCPSCLRLPSSNREYWEEKILRNARRDKRVSRSLRGLGWKVCRIRECRLKKKPQVQIRRIRRMLEIPEMSEQLSSTSNNFAVG